MGRELHDYWMNHKSKMYEELHQNGTLWEILNSESQRLHEMVIELTQQIGLAGAMEMARSEIYDEMMS